MKTLLCVIVKEENRYLDEWINYYKSLGFDKILIYDNNEINGERLNVSHHNFIEVVDVRGTYTPATDLIDSKNGRRLYGIQEQAYIDCYRNHSEGFDWIAFFDVDEFLDIDDNLTINEFLSQDKFKDVDSIQINWQIYGDNGHLYYEDKPVQERFSTLAKYNTSLVKSIVRTNNPNFISVKVHNALITDGKFVYPNGNPTEPKQRQIPNFECARIKHYYTKSLEEWIERRFAKTAVNGMHWINNPMRRMDEYFLYNKITKEKLDYMKEHVKDYDIHLRLIHKHHKFEIDKDLLPYFEKYK